MRGITYLLVINGDYADLRGAHVIMISSTFDVSSSYINARPTRKAITVAHPRDTDLINQNVKPYRKRRRGSLWKRQWCLTCDKVLCRWLLCEWDKPRSEESSSCAARHPGLRWSHATTTLQLRSTARWAFYHFSSAEWDHRRLIWYRRGWEWSHQSIQRDERSLASRKASSRIQVQRGTGWRRSTSWDWVNYLYLNCVCLSPSFGDTILDFDVVLVAWIIKVLRLDSPK